MASLPFTGTVNTALPLSCQQTQILSGTAGPAPATGISLNGPDLDIPLEPGNRNISVPVSAELEEAENRWASCAAASLTSADTPRVLLFGPGSSRTDPVYALRLLAKMSLIAGRPGEIRVYDMALRPHAVDYYRALPFGSHEIHLEEGRSADFERLRGQNANLILAIHPSTLLDRLFETFSENLVRGGLGLYQGGIAEELCETESLYQDFLTTYLGLFEDRLEPAEPGRRKPLFHSFFSERAANVHMLALRKK